MRSQVISRHGIDLIIIEYSIIHVGKFMTVLCLQAGIVNGRMYSQWRTNGVAFAIREGTYETTNKTLASGLVFKHVSSGVVASYRGLFH